MSNAKKSMSNAKMQHTPGPWAIDPDNRPGMEWNNHIVSATHPHLTICFMSHDGDGINAQGEANAALIARAPELLADNERLRQVNAELVAALTDLVERAEAEGNISGLPEYDAARAALSRAKGEK